MSDFGLLGQAGAFRANLMDLRHRRQELIASNVANADTPGYKARRLDFESQLAEALPPRDELAMVRTDPGHMPMPFRDPVSGEMQEVETPIPRGDNNSVDLEQEMARQTANQLLYDYAAQTMKSQIGNLRRAIDGR